MRAGRFVRGFSLTEFMIALLILAIIVGFAAPGFLDMMRQQKLTSTANSALVMLQFARSEAIKRQADVQVGFVARSGGWTIEVRLDATNELLRQLDKDDASSEWSGTNEIVFDLRGRPAAAGCTQLTVSGASSLLRRIDVFSGGKMTVKEGSCA